MTAKPKYLARRHRYADGRVYNPNRYDLFLVDGDRYPVVGGMLKLKSGKVIAYAGGGTSISSKVKEIQAYADSFVWANSVSEALAAIRPHLIERD